MKTSNLGFTLLELMVALVVAAILASMAIPSFDQLIKSSRLSSTYNGLVGELTLARSEAVKRSSKVTICASSDGASCNSSSWENGRLVFVDGDGNGAFGVGDTVLKVFDGGETGVKIRASAFANNGAIIYSSDGTLKDTGTLFVCDDRGNSVAKGVSLTLIGQPQKAYDTDSTPNGTIDDVDGTEVSCP